MTKASVDAVLVMIVVSLCIIIFTDLEYWKTSNRRLYVAKQEEYNELRKQISKNRLSLGRKRKMVHVDLTDDDDNGSPSQACIDKNIQTVSQICTKL